MIGYTPKIAMKHFLMTTDADLERAANALQQTAARCRKSTKARQTPQLIIRNLPGFAMQCRIVHK